MPNAFSVMSSAVLTNGLPGPTRDLNAATSSRVSSTKVAFVAHPVMSTVAQSAAMTAAAFALGIERSASRGSLLVGVRTLALDLCVQRIEAKQLRFALDARAVPQPGVHLVELAGRQR